jgi:hypothetical protein
MPNLLYSVVPYDFYLQLSFVRDFGMLSEMSSAPIAMDAKIHAFSTAVCCMHVWIGEPAARLDVQQDRLQ